MKAIIFDFDGVIHDSFDFHRNKIIEFSGFELPEQVFKDIHNGNFFHNVPEGIKGIDWEEYIDYIYCEQSKLEIKEETRNIILELNKQYELYVVSSGGTNNISDYFVNNRIVSVFKEILGLESYRLKVDKFKFIFGKHNLRSEDCIFVTDTLGDILEANEVNVKTVAVDFGYHNRETLTKGKPYKIISHLRELVEIMKTKI
jgi:phosphoglycolate phosphatase